MQGIAVLDRERRHLLGALQDRVHHQPGLVAVQVFQARSDRTAGERARSVAAENPARPNRARAPIGEVAHPKAREPLARRSDGARVHRLDVVPAR